MRAILIFAGLFSTGWGLLTIFCQPFLFRLSDMPGLHEAYIWRSSGILAFIMGTGYFFAAYNTFRYWPIVLMGLLTKILMPLSIFIAFREGEVTSEVFRAGITNHMIWWLPFSAILLRIYRQPFIEDRNLIEFAAENPGAAIKTYQTSEGRTIADASQEHPVLLIFLRHFGCTFCREALHSIRKQLDEIEKMGTQVILVHMVDPAAANSELQPYDLARLEHVSDPESLLYKGFGLLRGSFWQLFGPKTLLRGIKAGIFRKHGLGAAMGDIFQMPGIFLIHRGRVIKEYYHQTACDTPPYIELAECRTC